MKSCITSTLLIFQAILSYVHANDLKIINETLEEPSGIVYHAQSKTLFVVDDEGYIMECTTDGKFLRKTKVGEYDLEGVTVGPSGNLILAVEGDEILLHLSKDDLSVISVSYVQRYVEGELLLPADKQYGIEGIHYGNGKIYLVNQSEIETEPSIIFTVLKESGSQQMIITSVIDVPFWDLSGLTQQGNELYVVSDDRDEVFVLDIDRGDIARIYQIPGLDADYEGITFDTEGNVYIAVDGEGVYKGNIDNWAQI